MSTRSANFFLIFLWGSLVFAAELTPAVVAPTTSAPSLPESKPPPTVSGMPNYPPAVTLEPVPTAQPALPPQQGQAVRPTTSFTPSPMAPVENLPESVSTELRPANPETMKQAESLISEEGVYFNTADEDCKEVIKQISRLTAKNFLLDDKVRCKVSIITERKVTKDELWEMFLSALEVAGYTVVQGPAGLHKVVQLRDAISNPIPMYLDETPMTDAFITRLIPLKNINATDMANAIKGMVSKEGNLFAYQATNTIIITDTGSNINRLHSLIKELDRTGPREILEIIPIKYASAKDIADKIQNIFDADKKDAGGQRRPSGRPGAEGEEASKISKVIPDERTNSLIILASKTAVSQIRNLIAKLDTVLTKDSGKIHVHYLKNADATELSQTLTSLTNAVASASKSGTSGASSTPVGSALGFELEGKVNVSADKNTNALLIMASQKDYETLVERVIDKLDIPRRQVFVEAVVMELVIDQDQSLGIAAQGGFPFGIAGNNALGFGALLGGSTAMNNATSGLTGGVVSTDTVTVNVTGADGAAHAITVPKFFAALTAQQKNVDVNVLSTPNLLTLDNEKATIEIAQKEPFSQGQAVGQGGVTTQSFTREPVGLTLEMTPQINEGNTVKLKLKQKKSDILNTSGPLTAVAGPSTKERSVETTVMANDGQTIVIGGLLEDVLRTETNKIPLLGDIPILGWLFKNRTKKKVKSNLLVFITPHIIRDVTDFNKILQRKIEERNTFIDKNYSKRQRKHIREAIEGHAKTLLEYQGELPPPSQPATTPPSAPTATPAGPVPPTPERQEAKYQKSSPPMTPKEEPKKPLESPKNGLSPVQSEDSDLAY